MGEVKIDWIRFFEDHGVDYVTRGPNVKKNNVNIACPMCGDDPSHHMGVSLQDKGWGCWRGANHAGRKPQGLIRVLLNCSYSMATTLVKQYSVSDPNSLDEAIAALEQKDEEQKATPNDKPLRFREEFQKIHSRGSTSRFYHYLYNRGFYDVDELCKLYRLRCATTGRFKDRVIIPIYVDNRLVSWTSRAIGKLRGDAPRYLALSEDDGGKVNVFHSLWNWDILKGGGETLFIVEGPFDALKMDFYGLELDACTTCTFGTSMSEEQAMMIAEVSRKFKKSFLLYDAGATEAIFRAKDLLSHTKVECGFLPEGLKDPGEMSIKQVRKFICEYQ